MTITQEGNRLIVEKCEDGHDVEEETTMVAEPAPGYGRAVRRAIWQG